MKALHDVKMNGRIARSRWGPLSRVELRALREMTQEYGFSLLLGDLLYLDGHWYITHTGLLRLAQRRHCSGIRVQAVDRFCDSTAKRWAFKATVYRSKTCKGFVGYGDADPSNVSPLVRGAEMRVAETRAVNRALRKAYGIGICSIEEIGAAPASRQPPREIVRREPKRVNGGNGHVSLRDRLSQLIRQHRLDPIQVKLFAADYCGTPELRQASREQIESFINHLAESASKDLNALVCQLNSYTRKQEGAA